MPHAPNPSIMNIIITGASKGIGREIAKKIASENEHRVIAIARSADKLNSLRKEVPDPELLIPIVFNLREGDYEALAIEIRKHFSEIHALVNNAGALINKKIAQLSIADIDLMMDVIETIVEKTRRTKA